MAYKGTIVEESLLDNCLLNNFKINKFRISGAEKPEDCWHYCETEATVGQIDELTKLLKLTGWYAHFWRGDNVIVVYPDKKFEIVYLDRDTWKEVIKYSQSIGILAEQLDFNIAEYEE